MDDFFMKIFIAFCCSSSFFFFCCLSSYQWQKNKQTNMVENNRSIVWFFKDDQL